MRKTVCFFGLIAATVLALLALKDPSRPLRDYLVQEGMRPAATAAEQEAFLASLPEEKRAAAPAAHVPGTTMFSARQIAAIVIFSTFIYGTLLFGEFRLAFAFGGISLLLALNLMDIPQLVASANLNVILFLVGMFLVIGYLEENQFFERIVAWTVKLVGPRPGALLLALMLVATFSAALVDEVTSILFMTGTMLHLTGKYKLNPVPFVVMLVFATNVGSAMSSIGNPIGVMIALNAGFSFTEFLRWSAPVALVVNVVTYGICRWWFADAFAAFARAVEGEHARATAAQRAAVAAAGAAAPVAAGRAGAGGVPGDIDGSGTFDGPAEGLLPHAGAAAEGAGGAGGAGGSGSQLVPWLVFSATLLLLVTHGLTERLLGLAKGTMMLGAALAMGGVVLLLFRERARHLVEKRVDWWTLAFFMMLFASVGTLEHMRVTGVVARKLIESTGGNRDLLIWVVGWATGWLSAFLDNVLAVATFMPVIHDVRLAHAASNPAAPGFPTAIYWAMLFGGTFMGNMTVIGSTANIIALGVLEKRGHGTVRFGYWFKIGFIVSVASMAVAMVLLHAQKPWVPEMPPPTEGVKVGH